MNDSFLEQNMINDKTVKRYETSEGRVVYKLPVEAFSNHVTNCYLIMEDPITLIDTASGWETANQDLLDCFETLRNDFDEKVTIKDIGRVVITHGHIDHFGGVNFVLKETGAEVGIHELDASVLHHFRERLLVSSTNVLQYLRKTGLEQERVDALVQMNKWSKDTFEPRKVDFTFHEGQLPDSPLVAYHVPGHCPGQVCLQLDDILFTADHVLSRVTPNQSPESITRYTGVGHYMESLRKIHKLSGIRIGLGGHELEMENWRERIKDTISFHEDRLQKTYDLLDEPRNISQVSTGLFGKRMDYHILLACMETGAHLEYLYERGRVVVENIEDIEENPDTIPKYVQGD
jgi:glyoxylase-like metal-dependent hydrolase (beta-lactamase superfamily II)